MTNSSAYLVALLVTSVGLTIVLGLLWWTQTQRWKSMQLAVKRADIDSLAEDLPDERLDHLIERANFFADRLSELMVRPPPFINETPSGYPPREIFEQSMYAHRELQNQLGRYRGLTRRFLYVPVEGLEGRDELIVFDFLAVVQRLRDVDRQLVEAINRVRERFPGDESHE